MRDNDNQDLDPLTDENDEIFTDLVDRQYGFLHGFRGTQFRSLTDLALKPKESSFQPDTSLAVKVAAVSTQEELQREFSAFVDASAAFWGADLSAGGSILSKLGWSSNSFAIVVYASQNSGREFITGGMEWEDEAAALLNDPNKFYETYGSHYLSDKIYGADLVLIYTVDATEHSRVNALTSFVNGKVKNAGLDARLAGEINELKKQFQMHLDIKTTGGPAPTVDFNDIKAVIDWVLGTWAPAVARSQKENLMKLIYRGYWLVDKARGMPTGPAEPLRAAVSADMKRVGTLVEAGEHYKDTLSLIDTIIADNKTPRYKGWPENLFETTDKEITLLSQYKAGIKSCLETIESELVNKELDHLSIGDLIADDQLPQAYDSHIAAMRLEDRAPIAVNELLHFHHASAYIGLNEDQGYPQITSKKSDADKLMLSPCNPPADMGDISRYFVRVDDLCYVTSPRADGIKKGQKWRKSMLRHVRYDYQTSDRSRWYIGASDKGRGDFIRPGDNLNFENKAQEKNARGKDDKDLLDLTSKLFRFTVRRP